MADFNLPADDQRIAVIGRTGSGKTVAALYHLSKRDLRAMPWIVFDFKGDKNIAKITRAQSLDVTDSIPNKPGVYVVRPLPGEKDQVEEMMWRIWAHENVGVYIDEGYMVGNDNEAFQALLTQGRSKNIPMIVLSQRPVWLNRFVWSEADFFQVFHLNSQSDMKAVEDFVPQKLRRELKLPKHWSHYYDVAEDDLVRMSPVPKVDILVGRIDSQLQARRKGI